MTHTQTSACSPTSSKNDEVGDIITAWNTLNLVERAVAQSGKPSPIQLFIDGNDSISVTADINLVTDVLFPSSLPGVAGAVHHTAALNFERVYRNKYPDYRASPPGPQPVPPELLLPKGTIPTFVDPSGFAYPLFTNPTHEPVCILRLRVEFHASGIPRYPSTWSSSLGIPRFPSTWSSPWGTSPSRDPTERPSAICGPADLPPLMMVADAKLVPARRAGAPASREVYAVFGVGKFFSRLAAAEHVLQHPRAVCRGPFAGTLEAHGWMNAAGL